MSINFPNAPITGQFWPRPAVAGQPVYQWDGAKWISSSALSTTGAVRQPPLTIAEFKATR